MPSEVAFLIVAALAAVAVVSLLGWPNTSEWHAVSRYRKVTLVDGSMSKHSKLWGRKINGVWSYREMTAEEYNIDIAESSL